MSHEQQPAPASCPSCEFGTFSRNAYWMGKLMLPRDFIDEQRYFMDKLRHHQVHLHGWGVVCGLEVLPHANPACQDRFVCVEPGVAIDCCGYDIILPEKECIDLMAVPAIQALKDSHDTAKHRLQVCIRYRECPTEQVPVLYDDCGCETERCAPNRILESWELVVMVDPVIPAEPSPGVPCKDLWAVRAQHCELCDIANCVVLATIEEYVVGKAIDNIAIKIDNDAGRKLLPSSQSIKEVIDCLVGSGGGGGGGPGLDKVTLDLVDCPQQGSAQLVTSGGQRILKLEFPKACPPGLDRATITMVGCEQLAKAEIVEVGGKRVLELTIPSACGRKLSHICRISWMHGGVVGRADAAERGLFIAFDAPVEAADLGNAVVVTARDERSGCWCDVDAIVEPGDFLEHCAIEPPDFKPPSGPQVDAVRIRLAGNINAKRIRILVKGDFLRDAAGKGVDADHLPPWFGSTDGYQTGDGIEGGTFESWFTLE